jgi:outer membrane biosynthesis protein TonB
MIAPLAYKFVFWSMESRHLIRAAIAASVLGHLALAAGVYFADARPIERHDDSVSVDLVTPQELAEAEKKAEEVKPEPVPEQQPEPAKPEFRLPELTSRPTLEEQKTPSAATARPESSPQKSEPQSVARQQQAAPAPQPPQQSQQQSQQPPSPPPQQQALAPSSPPPSSPPPAAQSPMQSQPAPQSPPPAADQAPPQPDPDITVKYGVILGLPGFGGAPASEQADVAKADIAAFHRHLKTCLKLPADVARNDDAMVKLRAMLSPDGRLVAEPTVIEVRRPAKAALLLQAARHALEACQPYSMLPADKYNEWKVLDLPFTPQDFGT